MTRSVFILLLIGVASIGIRILIEYDFDNSALLYVGVPFLISLLLASFPKNIKNPSGWQSFWYVVRDSLIVMLGSSIVLFEGFVCVVMFMPIYFLIVFIGYLINIAMNRSKQNGDGSVKVYALPALLLVASLEGVFPETSFNRYNEVTSTQTVPFSVNQLKANLRKPIELNSNIPLFLKIFPMPYQVEAESLNAGDIHTIHYRYNRWFFTNTHEGTALLKIESVNKYDVKTRFIEDSSYLSKYLKLHGTHIHFDPIDDKHTKVSLTIKFDRKLDPAWYFEPLERYAVSLTAKHLINEVITP